MYRKARRGRTALSLNATLLTPEVRAWTAHVFSLQVWRLKKKHRVVSCRLSTAEDHQGDVFVLKAGDRAALRSSHGSHEGAAAGGGAGGGNDVRHVQPVSQYKLAIKLAITH